MAAAFVGSAALGAAFGQVFEVLYETVKVVTKKTATANAALERLKSTLDSLDPVVKATQQLNRGMGRPEDDIKHLIEQMKNGQELVRKYSNVPFWKFCVRYDYGDEVCQLEKALLGFFNLNARALSLKNEMEILKEVNHLRSQMSSVRMNSGISCAVPGPPDFPVGLDASLKELKMLLQKEEVSVLVLTAPGGCGKTALVTMLCQDEEIKGAYKDNILFVSVSKSPNLKVIVRNLFCRKVAREPEFQSDEEAINQLQQLLNQIKQENPILLILDDVWPGSESLLDKFKFPIPNYKILVTSRTAFPRFSSRYQLKPLNEEDAMKLFRHSAILEDGSQEIPNEDIINTIVKCCGGFPIALIVIGRSLCGESPVTWCNKLKDWSSGHSILECDDDDLLLCLQRSLEFSDKKIKSKYGVIMKECFVDLGSFPEDQKIRVGALIDMWAELYELDEDGSIIEISNRNLATFFMICWLGFVIFLLLASYCHLLILILLVMKITQYCWNKEELEFSISIYVGFSRRDASEVDSYYNGDFVLQHDLLRELAIHESSQETIDQRKKLIVEVSANNLPKWWKAPKQQPISAHLLSISTDEMFSSSWCNIQAPEVEVLVLNFQGKKYTLPEFVENMDKLKALIVTNYGFFHAELNNFHLLASVPYLKKIRLQKVSIHSLCNTPVKLMSLEKISLFMCNIGQMFRNCTIPISDCLPRLREINIDYCKDLVELPPDLCDIVGLEKLSITNCHMLSALPEGIGKLRNLKVLRLSSCTDLSELPESTRGLYNLSILDISGCLGISKLPKHIGELCNLTELNIEGCMRLRYPLPPSTMDLNKLKLVICDEERAKLWEPIKEVRQQLKIKVAKTDINLNWLTNRF
ncbi:hypothetical protein CJ030_MR0G015476 [Morella rubra]|uniref:RPW8 domain-containing protein n=1 Tax=Morella rubra TaxID=262757 RepID=A0A6A1UHI6_9ROSI|nr:hypothetical protein CJ030_MR0G015476 [Morella rubra]